MGAPKFTPAGIRRAIDGVRAAGDEPQGVLVRPDGSFVVLIAKEPAATVASRPQGGDGGLVDCEAILAGLQAS